MKGDFSRNTFSRKKRYHAVRMQQGRVLLDADWNEMVDIVNDQHTTAMRKMIGEHGGLGSGFQITFADKANTCDVEKGTEKERTLPDLYLHAGQYYANGYSCTLDETVSFEKQPYFPGAEDHKRAALSNKDAQRWLVYLAAWERHLTTIEDPDLAEPSLGGADTTTRTQLVWQVKMLRLEEHHVNKHTLAELPEWRRLIRTRNIPIQMNQGYAIENELFRIEIHAGSDEGEQAEADDPGTMRQGAKPATWKWSRDNASIAFPLKDIRQVETSAGLKDPHSLEILLATDQRLQEQLRNGDCVELDCDDWVLNGRPGWLGTISQVESPDENGQQRLMITVSRPVTKSEDLTFLRDLKRHPLVRRWDHHAGGGFTNFKIDSIKLLNRNNLEILTAAGQAALYPEDWVDLSGIDGEGIWHVGQVRNVSAEGKCQRIQVALLKPLPDGVTNETLEQGVEMRRWNDEALPVLPKEIQALEQGITVQFPAGVYRSGDYWLIPMRSSMNSGHEFTVHQVEDVHTCVPLALLSRQGHQWELKDFRRVFQDLGDVFARLESLEVELEKTKAWLAALQVETDIEDEEQEEEIGTLQEVAVELDRQVETLPILTIQQVVGRYRSRENLEPGDVVAVSLRHEHHVIKASGEMAPLGVVATRLDDFDEDEYSVVLSGPVICRIEGQVKAGDLLAAARKPGRLEKASLWVRWFQSEKIVARAIDNPTSPDDHLINVYFMPDLKEKED